jgi:hypothetical protein
MAEGVRREGELQETACTLAAGEGLFLLWARKNAEVDELLPILVAEAEPCGRAVLEVEMNSSHSMFDASPDAGSGEFVRRG